MCLTYSCRDAANDFEPWRLRILFFFLFSLFTADRVWAFSVMYWLTYLFHSAGSKFGGGFLLISSTLTAPPFLVK